MLKQKIKNWIKKRIQESPKAKEIIKRLYNITLQPASPVSPPTKQDVLYPIVKEYLYNKRINNYLLEKQYGYPIRRWVIEQMYFSVIGRFPNLDAPVSLNEKMQWMRFNYHDPLMTKCVDKYEFK